MKAYKGTDKDMRCRGMQYELGKTVEADGELRLCNNGLHSCKAPLDVWRFYPPIEGNRFFEAEADGESKTDGRKTVSRKLTLGAEIGIPGLADAHVEYTREKAAQGTNCGNESNIVGGDESNIAGGRWSNIAGGQWSNIAGGRWSNIAGGAGSNIVGDNGSNIAGGRWSNIVGGAGSNIVGDNGSNIAGGRWSNIVGGNESTIAGGYGSNVAGGNRSVLLCCDGSAKAGLGSLIVLYRRDDRGAIVEAQTAIIDGKEYKPDTWYKLRDGKIIEA